MKKSIPQSRVEGFEKKLSILNKKQAKYGLPLTTAKMIGKHLEKIEFIYHEKGDSFRDDLKVKQNVVFVDYEIENLEFVKKEGSYTYMGARKIRNGVPLVYCTDSAYLDEVSKETRVCDHCHTIRDRLTYHVFKDESGKILRIGSTCCKDYFGYDVDQFLNCFLETFTVIDYDMDYDSCRPDFAFSYDSVYEAVKRETNDFQDWIRDQLHYDVSFISDSHEFHLNEIRRYWGTQNGDFAYNCRSILGAEYVNPGNLTMAYAAIFFGEKGLREEKKKQQAEAIQPHHTEGEKIQITGVVDKNQSCETMYGYTNLIIINSKGVLYKMFTTSQAMTSLRINDEVIVKAVFKETDRFAGRIYQTVKSPKLVSVKSEETSPAPDEGQDNDKILDELYGSWNR